jgi:hypothetical protein
MLLAAIPETTPGGKLIILFWSVWVAAIFLGFLFKAFRKDDLEIVRTEHASQPPPHA